MVELDLHRDGDVLSVRIRVVPRARKAELAGIEAGALVVRIPAPPVEGKANEAVREFLAKAFRLRKSQVEIKTGEKSRHKIVVLRGAEPDRIRALAQGKE
ncbi:MAG: YggU family protein [Armatimonadetes bacterium]|nr:YggU family protein [Armatimonadota bacterium]